MSFGKAIAHCFKNYATFSGRASRSEYWFFFLFNMIVVAIPAGLGAGLLVSGTTTSADGMTSEMSAVGIFGLILILFAILVSIALIIPNFAVGCRRLHDRGTSGWLQLLQLVPCGSIVLLIFWLLPSQGANAYGEGPARA
jgi:uncharacterized membrane protein YhaH (DUF805 family)